jgi:hypothetical protein
MFLKLKNIPGQKITGLKIPVENVLSKDLKKVLT